MKRILLATLTSMLVTSCATLTKEGAKVELLLVERNARQIKIKKQELEKDKCTFIKKVEAGPVIGSTPFQGRLIYGLKNKVAEEGGNAVISSLTVHGTPFKTYGLAYKCPVDKTLDTEV